MPDRPDLDFDPDNEIISDPELDDFYTPEEYFDTCETCGEVWELCDCETDDYDY